MALIDSREIWERASEEENENTRGEKRERKIVNEEKGKEEERR